MNEILLALGATAIIRKYLENLLKRTMIFFNRTFDSDRDPESPDFCQIENSAGTWCSMIIRFFELNPFSSVASGVHCWQIDHNSELVPVKYPLLKWAQLKFDGRLRGMGRQERQRIEKILNGSDEK
ncbi:MAG: hypothetical protein GY749_02870 [Desulfobacteraceae bacterium]|nr:hypothetical protein [Desulfobacteraceae bacterium]